MSTLSTPPCQKMATTYVAGIKLKRKDEEINFFQKILFEFLGPILEFSFFFAKKNRQKKSRHIPCEKTKISSKIEIIPGGFLNFELFRRKN